METAEINNLPQVVEIEKLVYGGDGLGRIDGRVVMTPFVLPGETVAVETRRAGKDLLRGTLLHVQTAAKERSMPVCEYFQRCGGCQLQHASYPFQVSQKKTILREVLQRVGKIDPPEQIEEISGDPWHYRNRTQLHLRERQIGYLRAGSHDLVAIDHCPISSPHLNSVLRSLLDMAKDRRFPNFLKTIELFTNEAETVLNILEADRPVAKSFFDWCAEAIPGAGVSSLEYPVAGHAFRVSHKSFFQVNRFLISQLVDAATAGETGGHALDLYAGAGLFSLRLSGPFKKVTAIESSGSAVTDLAFNAKQEQLEIDVVHGSTETYLTHLDAAPDFVLADPPRAGLGRIAIEHLMRLKPTRLTIVSCDPATLARDLSQLKQAGYEIREMHLIDLFPQTYHIETITKLVLG